MGGPGWAVGVAVGLACGLALTAFLVRGVGRRPGPADLVTFARGLLGCVVAGLVAASLPEPAIPYAVLALAVPALALDAVDGAVARRTGTASAFGGRFDGEVDAFMVLVLSVAAAPTAGWWVVWAGLARYLFGAAGWVLPWMRGALAFRHWRKVVTASVGVALVVAVADALPRAATTLVLLVALALMAESFGRDVWSLWRARETERAGEPGREPGRARMLEVLSTSLALCLLWFAVVAPSRPDRLGVASLLRLPLEVVVLAFVALVLPRRWSSAVGVVLGLVLGVVAVLKAVDLGSFTVLARPFDVVTDTGLLGSGLAFVRDAFGPWAARVAAVAAVGLVLGALAALPWAVHRVMSAVARHRRVALRVVPALAGVWALLAVTGAGWGVGTSVAVAGVGPYVSAKVRGSVDSLRDREHFDRMLATDSSGSRATDLAALAGKDVLVVFVESYGRVAVEGAESGSVRELLESSAAALGARGYVAASGWLTSPTFGGSSWLAHSTLQAGVPVTDEVRYERLLSSRRSTLSSTFARAGWRTVALLPSTHGDWPEGRAFYGLDRVYDGSSLGYAGPRFGFSAVPDQYALAALDRLELGRGGLGRGGRPPVMAQVELTSSHGPWAPLPTLVAPDRLGDGAVYADVEAQAVSAAELWRDREAVPTAYRASIVYSLTTLLDFVARHDAVVVMLGDHQPATIVSGFGGNHDVPVSIIARDPKVLGRVSGWGWTPGLLPGADAPVWPMAAFRDRFVAAFSSGEPGAPSASAAVEAR